MDAPPPAPETHAATRVVLVDDHALVRAGLHRLLDDAGIEVVGEAGTGKAALEIVEIKRPSVVVLDIELPDVDGIEIVEAVQRAGRGSKVLVLSMHDTTDHVERAFAHGADGYLVKDAAEGELVAAIEAIQAGERYLYPPLGAAMIRAAVAPPADPLTDREREIVRLLALGHTNTEIAGLVHLSVRTIETHRAHAMAKLRLGSRAELVRWALDRGLLESGAS
ncbi:MAG: NarL family two-component response regulator [Thermoleophilia bacterium]|nr:NarL family two-component response regulator [Thermoleophilia bacterium]